MRIQTTVTIPDPPRLDKVLEEAFAKIEARLRRLEDSGRDRSRTEVELQRTLRELARQPREIVRIFEDALDRLSSRPSVTPQEFKALRRDLDRSISRLEDALNRQWRKITSSREAKEVKVVSRPVTVRIPSSLSTRLNRLEDAIKNSRPRTFGIMS